MCEWTDGERTQGHQPICKYRANSEHSERVTTTWRAASRQCDRSLSISACRTGGVHATHPPNIHSSHFFTALTSTGLIQGFSQTQSSFFTRVSSVFFVYVVANTERTIFFLFCFFPSFKNYLFNSSRWGPLTIKKHSLLSIRVSISISVDRICLSI